MLPLTRNIFRQTATSFNNTTKRWKNRKSYYIQIKWWSFAVCELLEKIFTCIHWTKERLKRSTLMFWMLKRMKYGTFWWIIDVCGQWCCVETTKGAFWFFFQFTLKHSLNNVTLPLEKSDQMQWRRVLLRGKVWQLGVSFGICVSSLNMLWWRKFNWSEKWFPSLIHPVSHFSDL